MLGGFMLGHADHLGAFAMGYIPAGVAYPMYAGVFRHIPYEQPTLQDAFFYANTPAGVSLVCGSMLNYIQVAPGNTPLWAGGLALIIVGVLLLAAINSVERPEEKVNDVVAEGYVDASGYVNRRHSYADNADSQSTSFMDTMTQSMVGSSGAGASVLRDSLTVGLPKEEQMRLRAKSLPGALANGLEDLHVYAEYDVKLPGDESESAEAPEISSGTAMSICLIAGLCGCLWSPLSTFARAGDSKGAKIISDPYVCLFLFSLGQLLAYPSVAYISGRLGRTGVLGPLRDLNTKTVLWGLLTGMSVSSGYIGYYLGSSVIPATACFGIANCNPLLALLLDVFVVRSFDGAPSLVKSLLAACVAAYFTAITLLVLSG